VHVLLRNAAAGAAVVLSHSTAVLAQTLVILPDTSQTSTLSVTVSEQARISVPAGVAFNVSNVGAATTASAAAVTLNQIVLSSATRQLRLSLRAAAPSFTPPVSGGTTWAATDVSWNAAAWTGAAGAAGTLGSASYTTVATCDAGALGCSTTGLTLSLAPKPAVKRSGTHTLIVTWKVESIGS
jgi:hypothetical protein